MKLCLRIGALMLALVLLGGCFGKVPGEAVELNVTMGKDIQALHGSYRALINTHFNTLRMQVDAFIKNRWMPVFIEDFTRRGNLKKLVNSGKSEQVKLWTKIAMEAGVKKQKQLTDPVDAREKKLLQMVDRSFSLLAKANEEITNHLKSKGSKASILKTAMDIADLKGLRQQIDNGLEEATNLTRRQTEMPMKKKNTATAPIKQTTGSGSVKKNPGNGVSILKENN